MPRDISTIRNIGIIAHIDAGKTTVTERMLFYCGATHKMGDVDRGNTVTDYDPEEQQRGITIIAACVTMQWNDVVINLIDTPGHVDFTAEVERSLRVLDGGVVVFSAREGVEAQSETVWRQADKYGVPRLAFINKLDREGADFPGTLEQIRTRLDAQPVVLEIPVGSGPPHTADPFRGVIDLVGMRYLTFTDESLGAEVRASDIPAECAEEAERWRGQMLEQLVDTNNELMEIMLADGEPPIELVRRVIRQATVHRLVVPVLCGSALDHVGIQPLLDAVAWYLPSPLDKPPVKGLDPKKHKSDSVLTRKPDIREPFCGLVFKIMADKHGDLHYVRVYSGKLSANSRVYNPGRDKKENVSQLWHLQADDRKQVEQVEAGDIVGVIGLRHSITGDTLCDSQHPILLESIDFPETVISMAIEPESSAERKKLAEVLEMMKRQDPTFHARVSDETGQTIISGMGELHLEIIKNRLLRDFKLDVRVHKPRVSYRETVEATVEVTGECHRPIAGQMVFARVTIRLQPMPESERPVLVENEVRGDFPPAYLAAVIEVLNQQGESGGNYGFPLSRIKVTLLDCELREGESNEIAFRHAAADAFNKALQQAGTVLLEPIMKLEITVPEDYLGEFVSDLQQRRAAIQGTTTRGRNTIITARAPLANLFGYSNAMRGLSQGRASCSMEPADYAPAPSEVMRGLV